MELTNEDKALMYEQYLGVAKKVALKLARKNHLPVHQVLDDAVGILGDLVTAWDKPGCFFHDPSRCGASTWVWLKVYWGLKNIYERDASRHPFIPVTCDPAAKEQRGFAALLHSLSDDAEVLVSTLLAAPGELAELLYKKRVNPVKIYKALQRDLEQKHWTPERVQGAWSEVKSHFT